MKEFQNWLISGLASGDVVRWGTLLCTVTQSVPGLMYVGGIWRSHDRFLANKIKVDPESLKLATQEEEAEYWEFVRNKGFEYNVQLGLFSPAKYPLPGSRFFFMDGDKLFGGRVRSADAKTISFIYTVHFNTGMVSFNESYPTKSIIACRSLKNLAVRMDAALAEFGLTWNTAEGCLYRVKERVPKGETYYYLSDCFVVSQATDNYAKVANTRYRNDNYFATKKDAEQLLLEIREKIQKGSKV